ncbi:hypothetical protein EVAR_87283_1 [Eumeta japonica]|uniref:Uncharacterized protein n=1 Tax=Eumeta variegata TaxID=151549 RepID=A0A4C1VY99_EUMVA|nr:hypothetical protein EVAR_87283_1 [Eumeta japonica]
MSILETSTKKSLTVVAKRNTTDRRNTHAHAHFREQESLARTWKEPWRCSAPRPRRTRNLIPLDDLPHRSP